MATEYISEQELKGTLDLSDSQFADLDIPTAIEAASRAIDEYCGRRFYADEDADNVRYYTALSTGSIEVDDLVELTAIATDPAGENTYEDAWLTTDYVLEPRNASAQGRPYTAIRRVNGGSFYFPNLWPNSVKVTGKFGWETTPAPVKQATTIIATQLLMRARDAPFGVVSFNVEIGTVARIARVDAQVRLLLDPYRRWRPFA